ncbi:hypothetical protein MesoLj131c_16320 [Mesorhizobium sp. 131-3-5]|uniref:hypothetical protein n=1 Tax=Mesorhizobium sp. 131-3-5 TaxID=2744520 RepID=UPI00192584EA|nr:hypothetical protein [Mesorhizobium sp. 131-3-5]BCH07374.1 hypothetical protein MesoLj131c_16320 [Mesorhizobium sp. 131-3-5]
MNRHLFHPDGRPVKKGDEVTSFRDEKYIVTGWEKNGRNRVFVHPVGDPRGETEYFVQVFDSHGTSQMFQLPSAKGDRTAPIREPQSLPARGSACGVDAGQVLAN